MEKVGREAADFEARRGRVKALRQKADQGEEGTPNQSVVTVTAQNRGNLGALARNSLLEPVVGALESGEAGLSYKTQSGAQVIAPADGKVLYAGPYHKNGQVLIRDITTRSHVVPAALGRVTHTPNALLLA